MNFIFLHGLGQSPSSWNETISFFPKHIKAHCPSLFNLCKDSEITYEKMYLAFEQYADEFSEPVELCGISLGAVFALNYAINHAESVATLVLIAPQYKMPKLLLKLQNIAFRFMPETSFLKSGIAKDTIIQLTNSMRTLNFENALDRISCPTLIICGKNDTANIKAAVKLAKIISNAELHLIENAGHEINMEMPAELAGVIHAFAISQNPSAQIFSH